jgi:hypothetical protein
MDALELYYALRSLEFLIWAMILLFAVLATAVITAVTSRFKPAESDYAPGWAGVLSLFAPGAGHVYKGYTGTGMALMIISGMGYLYSPGIAIILHVIVIVHSIRVKLAEKRVWEPERACCSVCGREFPESQLRTHQGKLWCAADYSAVLVAG